jgi:hypothetical protein
VDQFYVDWLTDIVDNNLYILGFAIYMTSLIPIVGWLFSNIMFFLLNSYLAFRILIGIWLSFTTKKTDLNYRINNLLYLFLYPVRKWLISNLLSFYFALMGLIPVFGFIPNAPISFINVCNLFF